MNFKRFKDYLSSRITRIKIFYALMLTLLCFGIGWLWMDYYVAVHRPVTAGKAVLIEIEKGDSFNRIIEKLVSRNLAVKPVWFKVIALQKNAYKKLKTGEYELVDGMTAPEIITLFVKGKTKQHPITFPEGWSFKEILKEIEKNPNFKHTLTLGETNKVMARLGIKQPIAAYPEGLFFPDTYFFEKNTSDVALLKRAYDKMQRVLSEQWRTKADGLPFKTPYEALILASIVEKETAVASERAKIAGVFIRRLQQSMRLQTDPTVIYGMGEDYHGNIRSKDLVTATPYNTYVISGLPPTPIAMPGLASINAVMHPETGDSLYFVARGDGTHVFSSTLKEHNSHVDRYQRKRK